MKIDDLKNEISKRIPAQDCLKELYLLADQNNCVKTTCKAYSFDMIKNTICGKNPLKSADAMLIGKKTVYLIEFKSGFSKRKYSTLECERYGKMLKNEMRLSIRLKACESLIMLEKILCNGESLEFDKEFIAVIDGRDDPLGARSDGISEKSELGESLSEKAELLKEMTENALQKYRKQTDGKNIMYDRVTVLYDCEFDSYIYNRCSPSGKNVTNKSEIS